MMETSLQKISRKTGKKQSYCKCQQCKLQCAHPCLPTPDDVVKLIEAGYQDRLEFVLWTGAKNMGVHPGEIPMMVPLQDLGKKSCTFFTDGLCELHDQGLKPTEGKLSHHSTALATFNPKKSIGWAVAKEWLRMDYEVFKRRLESINLSK